MFHFPTRANGFDGIIYCQLDLRKVGKELEAITGIHESANPDMVVIH